MNYGYGHHNHHLVPRYERDPYYDRYHDPYYNRPYADPFYQAERMMNVFDKMMNDRFYPQRGFERDQWTISPERRRDSRRSVGLWDDINKLGASTYDRAEKLFDKIEHSEEPPLSLEESDNLLEGKSDFEHLFKGWEGNKNAKVCGTSYQSSTIYKNGKAVTVSKHSKLNPDGTIRTEVCQEFEKDGHKDSRSWTKEDDSWKRSIGYDEKKSHHKQLKEDHLQNLNESHSKLHRKEDYQDSKDISDLKKSKNLKDQNESIQH